MLFSDILLTADFDRTLTAPDSTVPQRNIEAIRYFIDNGGAFTVNTGHSVPMTKVFRDVVPVNAPLLLYNGSAAYDVSEKKLTFCHAIHMDLWETVRRCQQLFPDLTVEVQGITAHYRFSDNPMWDAFSEHQHCAHGFAQPGDDLGPFLKFTLYGKITDVTVAHLFDGTPEEKARIDQVEQLLVEKYGDMAEHPVVKMSKSLGNGIDPIEVIDKFGADALRFSLVMGVAPGSDIRMSEEKIESFRNFANKMLKLGILTEVNDGTVRKGTRNPIKYSFNPEKYSQMKAKGFRLEF